MLAKVKSLHEAIKKAILAASLSTMKIGVIESIPTTEELIEFELINNF